MAERGTDETRPNVRQTVSRGFLSCHVKGHATSASSTLLLCLSPPFLSFLSIHAMSHVLDTPKTVSTQGHPRKIRAKIQQPKRHVVSSRELHILQRSVCSVLSGPAFFLTLRSHAFVQSSPCFAESFIPSARCPSWLMPSVRFARTMRMHHFCSPLVMPSPPR